MSTSQLTQAVLLLTAHFEKTPRDGPRPLTPSEWGRFAAWLKEQGADPGDLLLDRADDLFGRWSDSRIPRDRLEALLRRSSALALALEKWERAGLWVLTRADPDYPARLKGRLRKESPPVLFGCGNRHLLDDGGVAIVGSRDADAADIAYASSLGAAAAEQGTSVISGGARGVDEAAMLGALDHDGTAVGVLADSLLRAATSSKYRTALMNNSLVLVSPSNPEAGFSVGNAMARNKYIYCLSNAAVVVATAQGKGGTWAGAVENLAHGWVPTWVKRSDARSSGASALVASGAHWLPEQDLSAASLWTEQDGSPEALDTPTSLAEALSASSAAPAEPDAPDRLGEPSAANRLDANHAEGNGALTPEGKETFYGLFLRLAESLMRERPATQEQLLEDMDIHKAQLKHWLERAVEEGRVRKLNKPLRYVWVPHSAQQSPLFGSAPA